MIIKGGSRADAGQLVTYLLDKGDNGSVTLLEMRNLGAGRDLRGSFRLSEVEAEQTRSRKPLYHAQIAPAEGEHLTREQQLMAVEILERHLGFQDLPRVIVTHEKEGREHIHVAWSRFDRDTGRLRRDSFTKRKNVAAAQEISDRFGLERVRDPFSDEAIDLLREQRRDRSKAADSHAEQQQDERAAKPKHERKAEISALWNATDSGKALNAALDEAGYTLARGFRGYIVIDGAGEAHSLARQIDGVGAKDVRARLSDLDPALVPDADAIKAAMRQARQDRAREAAQRVPDDADPITRRQDADRTQAPENGISGGIGVAGASPEATQRSSYEAAGNDNRPETAQSDTSQQQTPAEDLLQALTRNHSTFTRQDLARLVDKQTGGGGQEPWMAKAGGFENLSDDAKASAERSYANWAEANPDQAERFGLVRYVSYVQHRQAERDAADPEALKVRQDSKAAFDQLMNEAEASPELIRLGPDHTGRERFTTRTMLHTELQMESAADRLADRADHAVPDRLRQAVPGLDKLGEQQRAALDHVTGAEGLALVVGFAGTGKSHMLGLAREAWEAAGYRVRGAALSGIAADGLQQGAGIKSRTLAGMLHQLDSMPAREAALQHARDDLAVAGNQQRAYLSEKCRSMAADLDASRLSKRDVIVVDEAAMVGSADMSKLLTAAEKAGSKVVLVGDAEQLQAVDAGAPFRVLQQAHGAREISEVRRQRVTWQREATAEFGRAETAEALARYHETGHTHQIATRNEAKAALVTGWTEARQRQPEKSQIILAYTRADVADLNSQARAAYRAEGKLGDDTLMKTAQGEKVFAPGDRLLFTKNDTRLGVKNGTIGTVQEIDGDRMAIKLDGGRRVEFTTGTYDHVTHGYASTVHKSQGVTVDRAHVLASRYMDRHAAYVGMTRHRDRVDLYFGMDEFKNFDSLSRRLSRDGRKDSTLDYLSRAADGSAPEGLRAAVRDFYRQQRPEMAPPAWTTPTHNQARDTAAPDPGQHQKQRQAAGRTGDKTTAEIIRDRKAARSASPAEATREKSTADMIRERKERHLVPEQRQTLAADRQARQVSEDLALRQTLKHRGPKL